MAASRSVGRRLALHRSKIHSRPWADSEAKVVTIRVSPLRYREELLLRNPGRGAVLNRETLESRDFYTEIRSRVTWIVLFLVFVPVRMVILDFGMLKCSDNISTSLLFARLPTALSSTLTSK